VLRGQSEDEVEFPFRVSEQELDIIENVPRPPASMLLLGRSGTGKTTVRRNKGGGDKLHGHWVHFAAVSCMGLKAVEHKLCRQGWTAVHVPASLVLLFMLPMLSV